jgi:hypothetical protein
VQEQHTAWKSRAEEYESAFRIRQAFFSPSLGSQARNGNFSSETTLAAGAKTTRLQLPASSQRRINQKRCTGQRFWFIRQSAKQNIN